MEWKEKLKHVVVNSGIAIAESMRKEERKFAAHRAEISRQGPTYIHVTLDIELFYTNDSETSEPLQFNMKLLSRILLGS